MLKAKLLKKKAASKSLLFSYKISKEGAVCSLFFYVEFLNVFNFQKEAK